jgi:hypothetical protein
MRIQVTLDSSAGSLTIHADGYCAATPPARLAVTLASIIEATLTEPATPAPASPADPADQLPLAGRPPAGGIARPAAADPLPAPVTTRPATNAPVVELVAGGQAAPEAVAVVVATDEAPVAVGEQAGEQDDGEQNDEDGRLRRAALQLLDDGLPDDEVCARLGISRSRLLRWDDPDGQFLSPLADTLAVTA